MYNFDNKEIAKVVTAIKAVASEGKVTFSMFVKKLSGEKYSNEAYITNGTEQTVIAFFSPFETEEEKKEFTISVKKFIPVIDSLLSFGKDISWDITDGNLVLSIDGMASVKIPTEESVPAIPFSKNGVVLTLTGKDFVSLFRRGGNAAKDDSGNTGLSNVVISLNNFADKKIVVSSTDGNIIAIAEASAQQIQSKLADNVTSIKVGVPAVNYQKILKLATGADMVRLILTENQFIVNASQVIYCCALSSKIMDVTKFIERWAGEENIVATTLDNDEVANALNLLTVASEECKGITFRSITDSDNNNILLMAAGVTDNKVTLVPTSSQGEFVPELTEGDVEMVFGIAPKYLASVCKMLNKGNITLSTSNTKGYPFVFNNGEIDTPDLSARIYVLKLSITE